LGLVRKAPKETLTIFQVSKKTHKFNKGDVVSQNPKKKNINSPIYKGLGTVQRISQTGEFALIKFTDTIKIQDWVPIEELVYHQGVRIAKV